MTKRKNGKEVGANRRGFIKGSVAAGAGVAVVAGASRLGIAGPKAGDPPRIYPNQDESEVRWGFLIDLRRCTGCSSCAIACKTESDVRLGTFKNGVIQHEQGTYPNTTRHFVPWLCNHCKNPPCLAGCPVEPIRATLEFPSGEIAEYYARATYQRPDGLVLNDSERCVGCGQCVSRCPYRARFLDRHRPAGGDPASVGLTHPNPKASDKCTLCVHRLENGVVPACVNTCPAEARLVGNLNDPQSELNQRIAEGQAAGLLESVGTEPVVFYIGLNEEAYSQGEEPRTEAGLQNVTPDL